MTLDIDCFGFLFHFIVMGILCSALRMEAQNIVVSTALSLRTTTSKQKQKLFEVLHFVFTFSSFASWAHLKLSLGPTASALKVMATGNRRWSN